MTELTDANLLACTYNAVVNYGSGREAKKMRHLTEALNRYERTVGRTRLEALVEQGTVDSFTPCPPECEIRPGGLFHVDGCENDPNHEVYRSRQRRATEVLPGGPSGRAGWYAADVTLVGAREG
jgi:hypothetical protein